MADALELTLVRDIDAPRSLVFRVWTAPEHLVRWWAPRNADGRDWSTPHCQIDFRPGGAWRICIRSPDGEDHWQHGRYREIVEPERIVLTFAWDGRPESTIDVTFEALAPERTRITFRQIGFENEQSRDGHREGWNGVLDRLVERLRT
jgi:uncharacterized protein YndB with AHSA1/START domain